MHHLIGEMTTSSVKYDKLNLLLFLLLFYCCQRQKPLKWVFECYKRNPSILLIHSFIFNQKKLFSLSHSFRRRRLILLVLGMNVSSFAFRKKKRTHTHALPINGYYCSVCVCECVSRQSVDDSIFFLLFLHFLSLFLTTYGLEREGKK